MIVHLKQQEFIDYLTNNGCEVVSNANWEKHDRVMLKCGDITFPLQMQPVYYYYTVNRICEDLGIESHELCKKIKEQLKARKKDI